MPGDAGRSQTMPAPGNELLERTGISLRTGVYLLFPGPSMCLDQHMNESVRRARAEDKWAWGLREGQAGAGGTGAVYHSFLH